MIDPATYSHARILVVDDEAVNVELIEQILVQVGYDQVRTTTDSSAAVAIRQEFRPDLLILDLHMPPPDGFAILEELRDDGREDDMCPVLVLTADASAEVKRRALRLGASDFLTKPLDAVELLLRIRHLVENRFLHAYRREQNELLERRVRERTEDLEHARLELLERLARVAEYRDDNTFEHAQRVGRSAALLAAALGEDAEAVELIRRAAPLHDIGKVGITDTLLLKPGAFTTEEFAAMTRHVEIGARILAADEPPVLRLAAEIALYHHERWDGSGYRAGLSGEDIPIAARIVAVADVFDALANERPYKRALPLAECVAEIERISDSHLDPRIVAAFLELDHEALLAPIDQLDIESPAVR
jgi:putative two-component system response regulator